MKPILFFALALFAFCAPAFCDEGISDPAAVNSEFSQWEDEFKSSLDSLGASESAGAAPAAQAAPVPAVPAARPLPPISTQDAQAARDLPGSDDGARVDRLENRVAQLERTVRALEDRQRILDRTVDDLKRRR